MSETERTYRHPAAMRRVLESLVPVICPPEAIELDLVDAIVDHVELTMGVLPAPFRLGLVTGMLTYDAAAVVWPPARGRFAHRLPPELAERWFLRWLNGNPAFRQLVMAIKQLLSLAHYEMPIIQERIGYRPQEWIEKVKKRRLEVYADDINKHQVSLFAPDPLVRKGGKKGVA